MHAQLLFINCNAIKSFAKLKCTRFIAQIFFEKDLFDKLIPLKHK